jgi:hypothetical protein
VNTAMTFCDPLRHWEFLKQVKDELLVKEFHELWSLILEIYIFFCSKTKSLVFPLSHDIEVCNTYIYLVNEKFTASVV